MIVNLSEIPGAFHLPRPNWGVIRAWVEENVEERHRPRAWAEVADQWLEALDAALGGGYRLEEGDDLIVFAPRDHEQAGSLLRFAETALGEIRSKLGDLARGDALGPLVILFFPDEETYYSYISQFYPDEGELGGSVGVCVQNEGYVHIVLQAQETVASVERTLIHELAHACVSHLELPAWVNEGLAQLADEHARQRFALDTDTAEGMREHWRGRGLQEFWWGKGFHRADEGQRWSYQLARILIHLILADHPGKLPRFIQEAQRVDAGDGAARDHLGIGVGNLAARFLGEGPWEPAPADAASRCRRANLYVARGEYERAMADCDEAIRLEPERAEAFAIRALAGERLGQYAQVIEDGEKAIRLRPGDPEAYTQLAWILAACPHEEYRDGKRAVELATEACKLTGYDSWPCLNALAAAYAEAGDFDEARAWGKEALKWAPEEEREGCKERLRLYEDWTAYRDPRLGAR